MVESRRNSQNPKGNQIPTPQLNVKGSSCEGVRISSREATSREIEVREGVGYGGNQSRATRDDSQGVVWFNGISVVVSQHNQKCVTRQVFAHIWVVAPLCDRKNLICEHLKTFSTQALESSHVTPTLVPVSCARLHAIVFAPGIGTLPQSQVISLAAYHRSGLPLWVLQVQTDRCVNKVFNAVVHGDQTQPNKHMQSTTHTYGTASTVYEYMPARFSYLLAHSINAKLE